MSSVSNREGADLQKRDHPNCSEDSKDEGLHPECKTQRSTHSLIGVVHLQPNLCKQ